MQAATQQGKTKSNNQTSIMNLALANSSYLPYTMSWIHRQFAEYNRGKKIIVCNTRENSSTFPATSIYTLGRNSKIESWLKAKFNFNASSRSINLTSVRKEDIKSVLKEHDINLLHAHFGTYGIYFKDICKSLNIPLLVTFHGHDISSAFDRWPAYQKAFKEFVQREMTIGIVISEEMKERLIGLGCPEEKIRVSYLGVPLEEFPFHERVENTGKTIFLHAGRLIAKKGVPDLISAFRMMINENPGSAELWIAGDGEEKKRVEQRIKELQLQQDVKMLGRLSNEDLLQIRYNADVFVLNCRTDKAGTKEGLPISTLEAAATGLPAISTYHAGIPESIIDEQTGYLVNEFDNKAFAEAMTKLLNKQKRLQMGLQARTFMEERFNLHKCNEALYNIYQESTQLL